MTDQQYTLSDVRGALYAITQRARENGELQYNVRTPLGGCAYATDDAPGVPACIAGAIVHALDADLFKEQLAHTNVGWLDAEWFEPSLRFTSEANDYLARLQQWADAGTPWHVCEELVNAGRFRGVA